MLPPAISATRAFRRREQRPRTLLFCDTRRLSHPDVMPGLQECTQTSLARAKPPTRHEGP
jgi:hypothetical protein